MSVIHEGFISGNPEGEFIPRPLESTPLQPAEAAQLPEHLDDIDLEGKVSLAREQVNAVFSSMVEELSSPAIGEPSHQKADDTVETPGLYTGSKLVAKAEAHKQKKLITRPATLEDMDQIVDLDRKLFKSAYGEIQPSKEKVREMMVSRWRNVQDGGGWMLVQQAGAELKGFITAFRTNKPWDEFKSWEDSTNGGTLDGKVDPNGKYAYVANLTVAPGGKKEILMAAPIVEGMKHGVEYGYFESRMPQFARWATKRAAEHGVEVGSLPADVLNQWAQDYVTTTATDKKGREMPIDWQLRMYKKAGMEMGKVCPNAFEDGASLNYGVIFRAPVPFAGMPKPVRHVASWALKTAMRFPKLMEKIL